VPEVKAALFRAGVTGITISRVSGHGGEVELLEHYARRTVVLEFREKVRSRWRFRSRSWSRPSRHITSAARPGGDGKTSSSRSRGSFGSALGEWTPPRDGGDSGRGTASGPEGGHRMRVQACRVARAGARWASGSPPQGYFAPRAGVAPAPCRHSGQEARTTAAGEPSRDRARGLQAHRLRGGCTLPGHSVGGTTIVGRLYDRQQNTFTLKRLALVLDKSYDPAKFSAGFHTEVLGGPGTRASSSPPDSSAPPRRRRAAPVRHPERPYGQRHGLQFKVGAHSNPAGPRGDRDVPNPNWSEGNSSSTSRTSPPPA